MQAQFGHCHSLLPNKTNAAVRVVAHLPAFSNNVSLELIFFFDTSDFLYIMNISSFQYILNV